MYFKSVFVIWATRTEAPNRRDVLHVGADERVVPGEGLVAVPVPDGRGPRQGQGDAEVQKTLLDSTWCQQDTGRHYSVKKTLLDTT